MVQAHLKCPACNFLMIIPRKASRQKKEGHVKHMYCKRCMCERGFVEVDGRFEYDPKNFINERVEFQ